MSENYVKCKCQNILLDDEFVGHFPRCEEFKKYFKTFDSEFGELLKRHAEPKENLLIIRVLLKQYLSVVEKRIRANNIFVHPVSERRISEKDLILIDNLPVIDEGRNKQPNIIIPDDKLNHSNKDIFIKPKSFDNNEVTISLKKKYVDSCQICKDPECTYLDCLHQMCLTCFKDYAKQDFPNMKCSLCKTPISENNKKDILGQSQYDKLEMDFLIDITGTLNECPQCREKIMFEKGDIDYNIRNEKNEKLTKEAAVHYATHRCRCPSCKIDFCAECKINPYHIGKTCEEAQIYAVAKRCRYDDAIITSKNQGPSHECCNSLECVNTYKTSCTNTLKCGHKCWGSKGETKCPPCLDSSCQYYINIYDQDKESYCNICYTEGLGAAPVVMLSCSHFIHYKCLETRLKKSYVGPKITFNHCLCPSCNNWVDSQTVPEIQKLIYENRSLYENICKMSTERLKFEGLDKDPRLTDPNSKWFKSELPYALNRLSYYMCYQCKKPYFAGLRECGDNPNVDNNNPNRQYDIKDLICGAHANLAGVAGVSECKTHGKDYIEYKCKFCCNVSSWFCWGTTHFCEDCHARQCKGDYVSKYAKDKLPKCDPSKCPVKVKHPDNGEEFALGCSVCRNNSDNLKNF